MITWIVGAVVLAIIGLMFGLVVIVGLIAAFKGKKPTEVVAAIQPAPAPATAPASLDDQADAWLTGLKRVANRKAASIISGRYADHEAEQITSAFMHGVQPRPLPPGAVIQTQYPWNISNPHPVSQQATQGTSMPLNPFVQAPAP